MTLYISKYTKRHGKVSYFGLWPDAAHSANPPVTFYYDGTIEHARNTLNFIQQWATECQIKIPNLAAYIRNLPA